MFGKRFDDNFTDFQNLLLNSDSMFIENIPQIQVLFSLFLLWNIEVMFFEHTYLSYSFVNELARFAAGYNFDHFLLDYVK